MHDRLKYYANVFLETSKIDLYFLTEQLMENKRALKCIVATQLLRSILSNRKITDLNVEHFGQNFEHINFDRAICMCLYVPG